ncbi:MAG: TetR/AcrR family transcriptional regulator [Bacteroidales bacterium]|nr:TetR/AcrR family transcriptional regulator [Bacteroidales bacterium]
MLNELSDNTEHKILEAAKTVFIKEGMKGARMQEIATEAGINKSLLHYYFRTKEKLFAAVFQFAFKAFIPKIDEILGPGLSLHERFSRFANAYTEILIDNPFIPLFVLHEINRHPEIIYKLVQQVGTKPKLLEEIITDEIKKGVIKPVDPKQVIINMISLCVFPIIARPIILPLIFEDDQKKYRKFLEDRKTEIADFIFNSIKVQ